MNEVQKHLFAILLTKYYNLIGSKVEIAQIKSKHRNECSIQNSNNYSNNPNSNAKSWDTKMHISRIKK